MITLKTYSMPLVKKLPEPPKPKFTFDQVVIIAICIIVALITAIFLPMMLTPILKFIK